MKSIRTFVFVLVCCGMAVSSTTLLIPAEAQEQPAELPKVPEAARRALLERQAQINALEHAKSVLQKEIDAVTAQLMRDVERLQKQAPSGYELGADLTYVKKK